MRAATIVKAGLAVGSLFISTQAFAQASGNVCKPGCTAGQAATQPAVHRAAKQRVVTRVVRRQAPPPQGAALPPPPQAPVVIVPPAPVDTTAQFLTNFDNVSEHVADKTKVQAAAVAARCGNADFTVVTKGKGGVRGSMSETSAYCAQATAHVDVQMGPVSPTGASVANTVVVANAVQDNRSQFSTITGGVSGILGNTGRLLTGVGDATGETATRINESTSLTGGATNVTANAAGPGGAAGSGANVQTQKISGSGNVGTLGSGTSTGGLSASNQGVVNAAGTKQSGNQTATTGAYGFGQTGNSANGTGSNQGGGTSGGVGSTQLNGGGGINNSNQNNNQSNQNNNQSNQNNNQSNQNNNQSDQNNNQSNQNNNQSTNANGPGSAAAAPGGIAGGAPVDSYHDNNSNNCHDNPNGGTGCTASPVIGPQSMNDVGPFRKGAAYALPGTKGVLMTLAA